MITAGIKLSQGLVWVKSSPVLSRQDYNWEHEPILYGWKEGAGHYFNQDFTQKTVFDETADLGAMNKADLLEYATILQTMIPTTVMREKRPVKNDLHPTMKPIALVARMIRNSTDHQKEQIVLDGFGGSGTTLMACEQTGRTAHLMEIEPVYCDVIKNRWEDFTGEKAVPDVNTEAATD